MPVYERGYRPFEGKVRGRFLKWWPITVAGLRTTSRKRLVFAAVPAGIALIVKLVQAYLIGFAASGSADAANLGPLDWQFDDAFFWELISWEVFWTVPILLVAGAGQIAEDFRTGALQIYFSKPIRQRDYVLGKMGTVVMAGALSTVIPAVLVLLSAFAFAPNSSWLTDNPWVPLKLLGFAALVSLVLGSLVLGLSSLARRGWLVWLIFLGTYMFSKILGEILPEILADDRWRVVHLGHCLDVAGRSLFSGGPAFEASPTVAWGILAGVFGLSMALLARKVRAVEVVS